jgi:cytochrome c oxidase subunit 4
MSLIRSLRPLSSSAAFARAQASVRYASVTVTSTRSNESAPILANIEASWKNLPSEEQYEVYQLEELQKKDWKELTVDEKKAGEWCAGRKLSRGSGRIGVRRQPGFGRTLGP